jgi:hypothetical protein
MMGLLMILEVMDGRKHRLDHIAVLDLAVAQIPDVHRHAPRSLCAPTAPARRTSGWPGLDVQFSVGFTMTERVQDTILALPEHVWTPAVKADGELRDGADVAELTGMLGDLAAAGWPEACGSSSAANGPTRVRS